MKKSKLSITLVTSFIAAMALTACDNSVSSNKRAIVSFTPYGSKNSIALITDDVYNQYKYSSAGVSKFYDKILEVLIRYEFKEKNFKGDMGYDEIENWAKNQVQEQKDKAKANAKSNGTKYDDEWDSILESNNVESSDEFKEKFIYEKEKEVMTKWFADDVDEELKSEFIGFDAQGNKVASDVKAAMPYHIRHILVKVDEASDAQEKFYKGTITEAQAQLLYNTVTTLASSKYTFSQVASMYSEDGSASSGGDVGIMTNTATSGSLGMVSEFQLGLYAYDVKYAGNAANADIEEGLGFSNQVRRDDGTYKTVKEALPAEAVEVPYEAFLKLGEYAKVTADKYGNKLANGSATVYPRNILWNKYLNLHNVFVIRNRECGANAFDTATANTEFANLCGANVVPDVQEASGNHTGFNAQGYLTDGNGNILICVRSEYGIHFMTIEKSIYEFDTLADYYSTKLPGEEGYKADSYVGYIESQNKEDYKKRADDIKSKVTSFDSTYDYRLFTWLTTAVDNGGAGISINYTGAAKDLGAKIGSYITTQKESNANKQEEGLEKVWKNYIRMLDVQDYNRNVQPWKTPNPIGDGTDSPYLTRLVSEKIADDFFALYEDPENNKALYKEFAEGGKYYYYA